MPRLTPLVIFLAACGPNVVNCPPGQYVDDDGVCVPGASDTAGAPRGDDDDDDLDGFDDDGDGWAESVGDCDDTNPDVHPGAEEATDNGIDDDCDRSIDEVEQSLADRVVEPSTAAACDDPGAWAAYQDLPARYLAVTLIRVGTTAAEDLPSLADAEAAVLDANEALASAGLELFVAADTVRYDSDFHDVDPESFTDLRNEYANDGTLHVFVTGSVTDIDGADARGLAIAPGGARNHGIAISATALSQPRALAHLVGHGLGLTHTHAGTANGVDPERVDGSNCGQAGDAICDTPADPGPSWAFPDGCGVDAHACALVGCGDDSNGQPYFPEIDNAMSVYPDTCGDALFSDDQAARMRCSVEIDLPGVLLLDQPTIDAVIEIDGYTVDDDTIGPSDGNNDGSWKLGETVEITFDVVNVGAEDATGVEAELTDDQPLVELITDQVSIGALPVGGGQSVTFVAAVPLSCTTDFVTTFTLAFTDDDGGQWTDEVTVPVSCDAEVDVEALSTEILSATLRPGLLADVEVAVRNNSLIPLAGITADLYLTSDATVNPATDPFLCRFENPATFQPGMSGTSDTSCTVPSTLATGDWRVGILVDPDDLYAETDETNNEAVSSGTAPVQTPPNLTIDNVTFTPAIVAPGNPITVSYTRGNDGNTAAGAFDLDVVLSTDATIGAGDLHVCTAGISSSPAGQSLSTSVTCDVPAATPLDDYYVGVRLDDPNAVAESNEADNTAVSATQVAVDGSVDLEITNVAISATTGFPGELFDIDLEMSNVGTFDSSIFELGVLFSPNTSVTSSDVLACSANTTAPLVAGNSVSLTFSNCAVPNIGHGDYTVGVWLDSGEIVPESDETNNILADPNDEFTIRGVDLWVHDVNLPGATSGAPGSPLRVEYTRENLGNASSGTFRLSVMLSTDATIDASDTQACFAEISSNPGDMVTTALTPCDVPSLPAGVYHAGILIDSLDDVPEEDESNNVGVATTTFTVL